MTRTEAIAQAVADRLLAMSSHINGALDLRSITFDVKLKPGTVTVRTVLVRPEYESVLVANDEWTDRRR